MAPSSVSARVRPSQTKIVATVGPACEREEQLSQLVAAGVDVFRLNMAHGGPGQQQARVAAIRRAAEQLGQPIAILIDLAGPKIRLGELPGGQLLLDTGDRVRFVRGAINPAERLRGEEDAGGVEDREQKGDGRGLGSDEPGPPSALPRESQAVPLVPPPSPMITLTTTYEPLVTDLALGDRVMLADGTVSLVVDQKGPAAAICRVMQPGLIRSRQGLNLPGSRLSVPALSDEDRAHATWAAENGIDFVGLSFVRRADEVRDLKSLLRSQGSAAQVIAKIEKPEALERLGEIITAADGVMVARGDLGVEIDVARVPVVQKEIIAACNRARKPVIVATQMLESMTHARLPTRAEVTDVANAILDGADACMLSGETAIGEFPREAVEMMHRIALATEPQYRRRTPLPCPESGPEANPITESTVCSAGRIAEELGAKLLIVATTSGATDLALAKYHYFVPTVGVSDSVATLRRMCLYWGVIPLAGAPTSDSAALLRHAVEWGQKAGLLASGDRIILVAGTGLAATAHNMIVVHQVA